MDKPGRVLFFRLINGEHADPLGCRCYSLRRNRTGVKTLAPVPAGGLRGRPRGLAQVLPSYAGVVLVCGPPCCGAGHEALNEGFLSAVGGFAQRGSNVTDG